MAKNNWKYWMTVGFHLAVVSIPAMIIAWILSIPLVLLFGGAAAMNGGVVAGFGLLTIIEMLIGFLIMGWLVVKYKSWVFKKSLL
jgi:hypothetical protein